MTLISSIDLSPLISAGKSFSLSRHTGPWSTAFAQSKRSGWVQQGGEGALPIVVGIQREEAMQVAQ